MKRVTTILTVVVLMLGIYTSVTFGSVPGLWKGILRVNDSGVVSPAPNGTVLKAYVNGSASSVASFTIGSGIPGNPPGYYAINVPGQLGYNVTFKVSSATTNGTNMPWHMGCSDNCTFDLIYDKPPPPPPDNGGGGGGGGGSTGSRGSGVKALLIANSIDLNVSNDFIKYLESNFVELRIINASQFTDAEKSGSRLIIMLGGPDAPEGMGDLVQEVLSGQEQQSVREAGARKFFVKFNFFTYRYSYGQKVMILAGDNRENTNAASIEHSNEVKTRLYS